MVPDQAVTQARILPDLEPLAVDIDRLEPLAGNPRRGDVPAIALSLATFGQRKPVVALSDGTVLAGNHTLAAARSLGWERLAVVWVDDDPTTASAFALADNRTAELGGFDPDALVALITSVQEADEALLAATTYSATDLARLLDTPGLTPVLGHTECPRCGHEWDEAAGV